MPRKVVLVLQGGGALGAFQCGVWKALAPVLRRGGHELVAVAGASIGAINAGMIARHYGAQDGGASALEALWRSELATPSFPFVPLPGNYWRAWNGLLTGLLLGNPNLFSPNYLGWNPLGSMRRFGMPLYHTGNALRMLERSFGQYHGAAPLLLAGATDVQTGETVLFDSASRAVTPDMLVASASIPMLFPPTQVDGRYLWDGEMRSATLLPDLLEWLHAHAPAQSMPEHAQDYLVIVVDMFNRAAERLPASGMQSAYRLMNIMLGTKAGYDRREFDAANAHIEALERLRALSHGNEPSPLADAIDAEYRKVVGARRARVEILPVGRGHVEHEHISRDFDYSPGYIDGLIAQGARCLEEALAGHALAGADGGGEHAAAAPQAGAIDVQRAGAREMVVRS